MMCYELLKMKTGKWDTAKSLWYHSTVHLHQKEKVQESFTTENNDLIEQ